MKPARILCAAALAVCAAAARPQSFPSLHAAVDAGSATSILLSRGPYADSALLPQFLTGNRIGLEIGLRSLAFIRAEVSSVQVGSSAYDRYGERYRSYSGLGAALFLGHLPLKSLKVGLGGMAGGGFCLARDDLSDLDRIVAFYAAELFLDFPIADGPFSVRTAVPIRLMDFQAEGASLEIGMTISARLSL